MTLNWQPLNIHDVVHKIQYFALNHCWNLNDSQFSFSIRNPILSTLRIFILWAISAAVSNKIEVSNIISNSWCLTCDVGMNTNRRRSFDKVTLWNKHYIHCSHKSNQRVVCIMILYQNPQFAFYAKIYNTLFALSHKECGWLWLSHILLKNCLY